MNKSFALYIHIPWCLKKCKYCDFISYALPTFPEEQYINALIFDLEHNLQEISNRQLTSIFIGGGTPSLLTPQNFSRLFEAISKQFSFSKSLEITIEANPGTLTFKKACDYRALGINRLSIGVQSFADASLRALGRIHTETKAREILTAVKKARFENVNIDLMYGLPKQTIKSALADLEIAESFAPTHLSWYQLTIEPNTPFAARQPKLPKENTILLIQQQGLEKLTNFGFHHYEISAFAKANFICKHNLNYWQFGDYLGIGAAVHGKITNSEGLITRYEKPKELKLYLENPTQLLNKHTLTKADLTIEFMLNALRLTDGFLAAMFTDQTGLPISVIEKQLQQAQNAGFIQIENSWIKPTPKGLQFLNTTLEYFL